MNSSIRTLCLAVGGALALGLCAGSMAVARQEAPKAGEMQMKLPAGWTMADMQSMMAAGTPAKEHAWLGKLAGTWTGKSTMWMAPDSEPVTSECKQTLSPVFGGRYVRGEMEGDMPGMGPMQGLALTGFDNVSQKFVGTWIDNMSTGIMQGTGAMSADNTIEWTFEMNCPITKKPQVMRQIEKHPDDNTMTLEMWTNDPKSGKEYKCMFIDLKRKM